MKPIHEATLRKLRELYEDLKSPENEISLTTMNETSASSSERYFKVDQIYKIIFPITLKAADSFTLVLSGYQWGSTHLYRDSEKDTILEEYENDCKSCFLIFKKNIRGSLIMFIYPALRVGL